MGLNSRWYNSLPTITKDTLLITCPANDVAGTAEAFKEEVEGQLSGISTAPKQFPKNLWICNDTAATIYLRGGEIVAATASRGIPVAPGEVLALAWESEPVDTFLVEAANDFTVACFY